MCKLLSLDFLRQNLSSEEAAGAAFQNALGTQLIKLNHHPGTKIQQKPFETSTGC